MAALVKWTMTVATSLMALVLTSALQGFGFLPLFIELFEKIVLAYFFNRHVKCSARHLLDVLQDDRIVKGFLVPVSVEGLHELAKINDSILTFLGIFFLQSF